MIAIVSGYQRCGSSLMLQMLQAGGMRVFHDPDMGYPAFETFNTTSEVQDRAWFEACDGMALKWLEPRHTRPAPTSMECRILWMKRDYREQARSAVKFFNAVNRVTLPAQARKGFEGSYRRDEARSLAIWRDYGPVRVLRFEQLIENPQQSAKDVCEFLGVPLDQRTMVNEVRERPTACLPYLLEAELMEAGHG